MRPTTERTNPPVLRLGESDSTGRSTIENSHSRQRNQSWLQSSIARAARWHRMYCATPKAAASDTSRRARARRRGASSLATNLRSDRDPSFWLSILRLYFSNTLRAEMLLESPIVQVRAHEQDSRGVRRNRSVRAPVRPRLLCAFCSSY